MPHNGNGLKKLITSAAILLCSWIGIRAFFLQWEGGRVVDGGHHLRGPYSFSGKGGLEDLWIRPDSQPFASFRCVYFLFAVNALPGVT